MKRKLIKIISVILVFNIVLIPAAAFAPINQYHKVQAAAIIDDRVFNAVLASIGGTAIALGLMSQNFTIPSADFQTLKSQFQTSLEADPTKLANWTKLQTDYLAKGMIYTASANELAKAGFNDIYNDFVNYLNQQYPIFNPINTTSTTLTIGYINNAKIYICNRPADSLIFTLPNLSNNKFNSWGAILKQNYFKTYSSETSSLYLGDLYIERGTEKQHFTLIKRGYDLIVDPDSYFAIGKELLLIMGCTTLPSGFNSFPLTRPSGNVIIENNNIVNYTNTAHSINPNLPYISDSIPLGTISNTDIASQTVTDATGVAIPWGGAVPVDVPISVPIDDPTVPVDPPAEEDNTTIGKILASLIPISGILSGIQTKVGSISDFIATGFDSVIDGIGDVTGSLTGGITTSLSNIQSSISDFTKPATDTINYDPIKNIPAALFTKFPFSIPWDLYNLFSIMNTDNRSPPSFIIGIPLSCSTMLNSFGMTDLNFDFNLDNFDPIFKIIRTAELLLFIGGLILSTKKLIWS